jgi:hypothetical protein
MGDRGAAAVCAGASKDAGVDLTAETVRASDTGARLPLMAIPRLAALAHRVRAAMARARATGPDGGTSRARRAADDAGPASDTVAPALDPACARCRRRRRANPAGVTTTDTVGPPVT